ncbi:MAG: TolC family protein [Deltaproteobacteria bacterium]|nr:TolC family protein [Deltaproteobacteria bacterium]
MKPRFVFHMSDLFMFVRSYLKLSISLMFLMVIMLHGQSARGEDLMGIYKLALENDSTFQGERYRHDASPEIYKQACSELMPSVSLDASYQYTRQEIFDTDVAVYGADLARYPSKGYTLSLTQPILVYPSFMRVLQAQEEVKRTDLEFEAAKQELIFRVVELYIGIMEAHDNLEFTLAEEEAIRVHFELAQERYNNGLAPITDFHDAKARLASVTARKSRVENGLDDALEALAEVTGQKIDNLAKLKFAKISIDYLKNPTAVRDSSLCLSEKQEANQGEMPLISPDPDDINKWVDAGRKQNLEVLVQEQAMLVAKREVERQRGGHYPSLAFVARLNRDNQGGSLFGGESDLETREAILQMSFPIFEGLSVMSKTREAQKLYAATEQDLEKAIRLVKREARAAFLGVKSAIENSEALRQSVMSNQIALEAKREGFKSGLFPSLAVLDAERDLHQAKLEYAKAQYEYILNSFRLKKAMSTLNEEDIYGVNKWLE